MGDEPKVKLRRTLRRVARSTLLLVRDPQRWSSRWYRDKNTMDYVAVVPRKWRETDRSEEEE